MTLGDMCTNPLCLTAEICVKTSGTETKANVIPNCNHAVLDQSALIGVISGCLRFENESKCLRKRGNLAESEQNVPT